MAELVLVGGGHAHVQVLRRFMMRPVHGTRFTLVLDRPEAVYSGMVPGFVAGDYRAEELEIDGLPLGRRARARVLLSAAVAVDAKARRIALQDRPDIAYDLASLDVGSSVRGLELPGVREHALATRPIRGFVDALDARLERAQRERQGEQLQLAIVGGGAAGVELAFTIDARLRRAGRPATLALFTDADAPLPDAPARSQARLRAEARSRGIALHGGRRVVAVEKHALRFEGDGGEHPCDLAVWATGASPPALLASSDLPLDAAGFLRVRSTLQVEGHDDLLAAGDCIALGDHPWVPKAGVYAVRQGPVLDANLRACLAGRSPRPYHPQRDFLRLIHLGAGRALAAKWGLQASGRAVWWLKDAIDRRFMRRFQVLDADGAPSAYFPSPESMGGEEMACGGCAAKVAPRALERALARLGPGPPDASLRRGLEAADDAAAFSLPSGEVVLASVDAFRAFSDDPWLVGRVAAVNAVSDLLAKGGRARHALALVTVPEAAAGPAEETLFQVLSGIRAALDPLGVALVGGHSTEGEELFVGLSVTGTLDGAAELLPLDALRVGQRLILSKGLGTGVVLAADMRGLARGAWLQATHASMLRPNFEAARLARQYAATACTDVSGFGLAGHLGSMLRASGVAARLDREAIPALDGALTLLARGLRSTFHEQNRQAAEAGSSHPAAEAESNRQAAEAGSNPPAAEAGSNRQAAAAWSATTDVVAQLLIDPQTSGGLVFGVPAELAGPAVTALHEAGDTAAADIGEVVASRPGEPRLRLSPV